MFSKFFDCYLLEISEPCLKFLMGHQNIIYVFRYCELIANFEQTKDDFLFLLFLLFNILIFAGKMLIIKTLKTSNVLSMVILYSKFIKIQGQLKT